MLRRYGPRLARTLSTETTSTTTPEPPVPVPPPVTPRGRSSRASTANGSLAPRRPQPSPSGSVDSTLRLPPDFGRNQLLSVPNSTRALLEDIVGTFKSPIRYAFAYGSGVFEQEGAALDKGKTPMLDFIFAVSHPEHWHSINLAQNPSHYAIHARLLGSDFVGRLQGWGPAAVWFNPFVPVNGVVS